MRETDGESKCQHYGDNIYCTFQDLRTAQLTQQGKGLSKGKQMLFLYRERQRHRWTDPPIYEWMDTVGREGGSNRQKHKHIGKDTFLYY